MHQSEYPNVYYKHLETTLKELIGLQKQIGILYLLRT